MRLDSSGVDAALSALGEHLRYMGSEAIEIVVCGGSALQALGLVDRTTRDVDVLALVQVTDDGLRHLLSSEPLPADMVDAARIVARDLSLPGDWLNCGPAGLLCHGLPDGFVDRLHSRKYSSSLTVCFVGRFDQICFKAYATINDGRGAHHLADLRLLAPSDEEMLSAAGWCLTQESSEEFPRLVVSFLRQVGYPDVADRLGMENQE